MTLLRMSELRSKTVEDIEAVLKDQRAELMHENGLASMGGAPPNPGKIRAIRKNIARILTVIAEKQGGK